jgi:hypothetical protein
MGAAAITPSVVQKTYVHSTGKTGSPVRLVEYFIKGTKSTQSDWVVQSTYAAGTYLGAWGFTLDGSGDGAAETVTFTNSNKRIVCGSSNVGTVYLKVLVQE